MTAITIAPPKRSVKPDFNWLSADTHSLN